jgi:hypothetical protein
VSAGLELLQTRLVQPQPLSVPRRAAQALHPNVGETTPAEPAKTPS